MEKITIVILNWGKYNPKKGQQSGTWFRFEHSFFEEPKFFKSKPSDRLTWIYLLCCASKQYRDTIDVYPEHAEHIGGIKKHDFYKSLQKLSQIGVIISRRSDALLSDLSGAAESATNERTNERTNDGFDFDSLYNNYPRKDGKTAGIKACQKLISSQQDFDRLKKAIDTYAAKCRQEKTEKKFIKHFSTFMHCWEDYAEIGPPQIQMLIPDEEIGG